MGQRSGKITKADYPNRTFTIDSAWPSQAMKGRIFEVGVPGHWTQYTIATAKGGASSSDITVTHGADFYLSRVRSVDGEQGLVHCAIGIPHTQGEPCPGQDKNWVASNEQGTKFWRADYLGGSRDEGRYTFKLSGDPVSEADFGNNGALKLWEYGVGDTVRQSTFAALRRIEPGVYELSADVDVTVALLGSTIEMSRDGKTWLNIQSAASAKMAQQFVSLDTLRSGGRVYLRVK
jgi:hypothetical protein